MVLLVLVMMMVVPSQAQRLKELQEQLTGSLIGEGKKITTDDLYFFDLAVVIEMTTLVNNKPSTTKMSSLYSKDAKNVASEITSIVSDQKKRQQPISMMTILDFENQAIIMIMHEQKMAQVIAMPFLESAVINNDQGSVIKTGRTKNILDYSCFEYRFDLPDASGTFWITEELGIESLGFQESMGYQENKNENFSLPNIEKGFMMEMNMVKKGKVKSKEIASSTIKVTQIVTTRKTIDMSKYQKLNGGLGMMGSR